MSACSIFERISVIGNNSMDNFINMPPKRVNNPVCAPSIPPGGPGPGPGGGGGDASASIFDLGSSNGGGGPTMLERDYYGCYCLKFIVKNGTHITEDKVQSDFGQFGEVVDVRGPGLFSGLRGNHVYVRYIDKADAEEALKQLGSKYHQLTPASISDVLPDNYGLYTISFYNKTGIPSSEVRKEFSKFGEVKNLTGSLDVKGGRVFVSYKDKVSAVQALQAFFFRKDRYPNMKFALPRCEKDYFGCYCLKFYNKSGDVTEEKVLKDFGQFGEVVDVRGPGLFDVTGDDVYVRYKEKSSAEQALIELVGRYDSLCLAPPSDIQADKFGYFTITFVNDKCLSKSDVWYIFSKFGTVACVNGTFDCKKGRVFVSYKEKQGALNALETMLITKEYHLQVSKNSTVRKNDYNVVGGSASSKDSGEGSSNDFSEGSVMSNGSRSGNNMDKSSMSSQLSSSSINSMKNSDDVRGGHPREQSRSRESSMLPPLPPTAADAPAKNASVNVAGGGSKNGLVKFNRNVEKDIFGYYCLSFLNEDGDINEKKVRHDFGKFGEVVSVRGALGKQKGHVFVRFRRKEAAENCLNCLNSFPLSEMSELFGKYLFLSPATPRDIDCDMYGLYSISFLNLNMKTFREIRSEFAKFGEIVRLTSGGGGNTDELVSISYADKSAAVKALQTHFTNKEFPYLDIAKGSSLLLVNSSDSSDNEDNESDYIHHHHRELQRAHQQQSVKSADPFHDPSPIKNGFGGSDVVDELLKPLQSYFNIYRTGQYHSLHGDPMAMAEGAFSQPPPAIGCPPGGPSPFMNGTSHTHQQPPPSSGGGNRSPDKKYRIKSVKQHPMTNGVHKRSHAENGHHHHSSPPPPVPGAFAVPPPSSAPPRSAAETVPSHPPPPLHNLQPMPSGNPTSSSLASEPNTLSTNLPESASTSDSTSPISSAQASPERETAPAAAAAEEHPLNVVPFGQSAPAAEASNGFACDHSISSPTSKEKSSSPDQRTTEDLEQLLHQPMEHIFVYQDMLGFYSLSFFNKAKDLQERKLRLDFGSDDIARIRGLAGLSKSEVGNGEAIIVSFTNEDAAIAAVNDRSLHCKYPGLTCAPRLRVRADKDSHYSIEFINSGMNGIREITNEFSRHGEVLKVMAVGAKNTVKRFTVSYADKESAFAAVKLHGNSKDFLSVDFARECLELIDDDDDQGVETPTAATTASS